MSVSDVDTQWYAQPMPWHVEAFTRLITMNAQGRLPHALLLTGTKASGKAVFAAALAAALLCRRGNDGACGQCESCLLARGGGHGDYRWLAPEEGKRAIGIEPVRGAIRFVQQTAGYGEVKVLVLSPAEAMTTAAANALLKTLEEPAGASHLILVSHRPGDLPPTVRSRCQTIVLPNPSESEAIAWLRTISGDSEERCRQAQSLAMGRVMDALNLIESNGLDDYRGLQQQLVSLMRGELGTSSAVGVLAGYDLDLVLECSANQLEAWLKHLPAQQLPSYRNGFDGLTQIQQWLSASRRGLNLSRDLMLRELCLMMAGIAR